MDWKKLKSMVGPPKTREMPSLWTNLSSKHSVAPWAACGPWGALSIGK